jgi:hypothetical protein
LCCLHAYTYYNSNWFISTIPLHSSLVPFPWNWTFLKYTCWPFYTFFVKCLLQSIACFSGFIYLLLLSFWFPLHHLDINHLQIVSSIL